MTNRTILPLIVLFSSLLSGCVSFAEMIGGSVTCDDIDAQATACRNEATTEEESLACDDIKWKASSCTWNTSGNEETGDEDADTGGDESGDDSLLAGGDCTELDVALSECLADVEAGIETDCSDLEQTLSVGDLVQTAGRTTFYEGVDALDPKAVLTGGGGVIGGWTLAAAGGITLDVGAAQMATASLRAGKAVNTLGADLSLWRGRASWGLWGASLASGLLGYPMLGDALMAGSFGMSGWQLARASEVWRRELHHVRVASDGGSDGELGASRPPAEDSAWGLTVAPMPARAGGRLTLIGRF